LWAETITKLDDIEYLMFPRLPGVAEIGWTPVSLRNWDEYKFRLAEHAKFFEEWILIIINHPEYHGKNPVVLITPFRFPRGERLCTFPPGGRLGRGY
jgi:hypothetical protein